MRITALYASKDLECHSLLNYLENSCKKRISVQLGAQGHQDHIFTPLKPIGIMLDDYCVLPSVTFHSSSYHHSLVLKYIGYRRDEPLNTIKFCIHRRDAPCYTLNLCLHGFKGLNYRHIICGFPWAAFLRCAVCGSDWTRVRSSGDIFPWERSNRNFLLSSHHYEMSNRLLI